MLYKRRIYVINSLILNERSRFKIIKVHFQKPRIFEIRVHELMLAKVVQLNKHSEPNNMKNHDI